MIWREDKPFVVAVLAGALGWGAAVWAPYWVPMLQPAVSSDVGHDVIAAYACQKVKQFGWDVDMERLNVKARRCGAELTLRPLAPNHPDAGSAR